MTEPGGCPDYWPGGARREGGVILVCGSGVGVSVAANKLIEVNKVAVIITAWSSVVKAVAPIANRTATLELNMGANSPDIERRQKSGRAGPDCSENAGKVWGGDKDDH